MENKADQVGLISALPRRYTGTVPHYRGGEAVKVPPSLLQYRLAPQPVLHIRPTNAGMGSFLRP
jgi:hypothetical protein